MMQMNKQTGINMIAESKYSTGRLKDKRNTPESRTEEKKTVKWKRILDNQVAQYNQYDFQKSRGKHPKRNLIKKILRTKKHPTLC